MSGEKGKLESIREWIVKHKDFCAAGPLGASVYVVGSVASKRYNWPQLKMNPWLRAYLLTTSAAFIGVGAGMVVCYGEFKEIANLLGQHRQRDYDENLEIHPKLLLNKERTKAHYKGLDGEHFTEL